MDITEPNGRLARWPLRISEFDYDNRYIREAKTSLFDCISRICTDGKTTVVDIPCFIVEPRSSGESLGDEKAVPVETCGIGSMSQLRLP